MRKYYFLPIVRDHRWLPVADSALGSALGQCAFSFKMALPESRGKGATVFGVSVHFISKWHYLNPEAK
jgi:hypothetical protein